MSIFLSTYINKVDAKGRVSVPAAFRHVLSSASFQGVVLFRSYTLQAIEGCSMDRMAQISQSVDRLDLFSEAQDDFLATLFSEAEKFPFDGDGRIMLPVSLRDCGGIKDQAAFVGRGATFQIWAPKIFLAHQEVARERLHQRGATLKLHVDNKGATDSVV